jgi:hypothetical protein
MISSLWWVIWNAGSRALLEDLAGERGRLAFAAAPDAVTGLPGADIGVLLAEPKLPRLTRQTRHNSSSVGFVGLRSGVLNFGMDVHTLRRRTTGTRARPSFKSYVTVLLEYSERRP